MGKRSNFPRHRLDFYPTPLTAAVPLVPFLRAERIRSFAEPCAGDGALVRHLEAFGLKCVYAGDIQAGQDALALDHYGNADAIVTNPPHTWKLLRPLLEHFQRVTRTWLLLGTDFAANARAAAVMPSCSDIVPIGRVRWIAGTEHSSKENYGWYRFDARHAAGPVFHWRGRPALKQRAAPCIQCRATFQPRRSDSLFCSNACRQRAYRERRPVTHP